MISGVNNDTESFYGLCLRLYVFPTKPVSPPISTIMNEGMNIIKCATKLNRRLHGNRRKCAGREASQLKADVEALQACSISLLVSKRDQKTGNTSVATRVTEWEFILKDPMSCETCVRFLSCEVRCRAQIDSLLYSVLPWFALTSCHFVAAFQLWIFGIFWRIYLKPNFGNDKNN